MQYHVYFIKSSEDYYIRDSGVVGNARPCQGRDRGFEPRLSLFYFWPANLRFMRFAGFCFSDREPIFGCLFSENYDGKNKSG